MSFFFPWTFFCKALNQIINKTLQISEVSVKILCEVHKPSCPTQTHLHSDPFEIQREKISLLKTHFYKNTINFRGAAEWGDGRTKRTFWTWWSRGTDWTNGRWKVHAQKQLEDSKTRLYMMPSHVGASDRRGSTHEIKRVWTAALCVRYCERKGDDSSRVENGNFSNEIMFKNGTNRKKK